MRGGIAGLAAGVRFVRSVGVNAIAEHEASLAGVLADRLRQIEGVSVYCDLTLRRPRREFATPRTDREGARRSRPLIRLNREDKLSVLQKLRFAVDSPLEGAGFEPSVPLALEGPAVSPRAAGDALRGVPARMVLGKSETRYQASVAVHRTAGQPPHRLRPERHGQPLAAIPGAGGSTSSVSTRARDK